MYMYVSTQRPLLFQHQVSDNRADENVFTTCTETVLFVFTLLCICSMSGVVCVYSIIKY